MKNIAALVAVCICSMGTLGAAQSASVKPAKAAAEVTAGAAQQARPRPFTEAPAVALERAADNSVMASVFARVSVDAFGASATDQSASLDLEIFRGVAGKPLVARLIRTETQASGRIAWIGTLEGIEMSSVTFIVDRAHGMVTGSVTYPGAVFRITHVGAGVHGIFKLNPAAFGDEEAAATPREEPARTAADAAGAVGEDSGATIDLLIVYSPSARTYAGSAAAVQGLIELEVAQANQSFVNTGIGTQFRLVGTSEVAFTEAGLTTDVDRLRLTNDGHADGVHALRDQLGADLVAIVVNEPTNVSCGQAADILYPAVSEAPKAFQATVVGCLGNGMFILAHEFGHLLGARHDRFVDPTENSPFTYNHGFVSPLNNWHTIMAYRNACGNCGAVQYWSNPDLQLNGVRMGVPEGQTGATDNRKTLTTMAPYVANFRSASGGTPTAATLSAPTGTIATQRPAYSWNRATGATWYQLYVQEAGGAAVVQTWFDGANVCGATACAVTPAVTLTAGKSYQWWIQTWNTTGYGPWSAPQTFTVGNTTTASAVVKSVWQVANTPVGGTARLWAQVRNTGTGALPSDAKVWFYVSGPNWTGDNYVASASVATLAAGTEQWYYFDWTVAAGRPAGTYTYWARVLGTGVTSAWSAGQSFTVTAATSQITVVSGYQTSGVKGGTATLWARVRNDGSNMPPAGTKVWFWVTDANGTGAWVGGTPLDAFAPGTDQWYGFSWNVPISGPSGTYTYWARVYSPSGAISEWGPAQTFLVR